MELHRQTGAQSTIESEIRANTKNEYHYVHHQQRGDYQISLQHYVSLVDRLRELLLHTPLVVYAGTPATPRI